jgi:3-mercaptopyruvate sulfurtransferase SseA
VILYADGAELEAEAAYQFLREQGHRSLAILEEGFGGWRRRGYPTEP